VEDWPGTRCRPEVVYLLELFKKHNAKATFFVLGPAAEKDPELIKEIDRQGHEVASHGGTHEQLFNKTPGQFYDEMSKNLEMLRNITGKTVLGFRAPHFSIFEGTYWAFDVLVRLGIKYDSSIFPIKGPRYGVPDFPRGAVRVYRNNDSIVEVPLSTLQGFGRNWPVSGGGYFRLLPYCMIRRAVKTVNGEGLPFIVYCHPYEFSPDHLRCHPALWRVGYFKAQKTEVKFNLFRNSMRRKISGLLDEFNFCPFKEALRNEI
jgi:polysaccharide deacetylase family protein (PEP-CTERM system associated)